MTSSKGHLFIISAPSGAGKTTLCRAVRDEITELKYSVSHTTRLPRKGEIHGVDYFFIKKETFIEGIENGKWAEWAMVHDNYYGTSSRYLSKTLDAGDNILLDIDVQGAKQILKVFPAAITIFIMPPSLSVLKQRLEKRGTDSPEVIEKRLKNAVQEINSRDIYQYVVINDDLKQAIAEIKAIFNTFIQ